MELEVNFRALARFCASSECLLRFLFSLSQIAQGVRARSLLTDRMVRVQVEFAAASIHLDLERKHACAALANPALFLSIQFNAERNVAIRLGVESKACWCHAAGDRCGANRAAGLRSPPRQLGSESGVWALGDVCERKDLPCAGANRRIPSLDFFGQGQFFSADQSGHRAGEECNKVLAQTCHL
jgi:hypothetical protein